MADRVLRILQVEDDQEIGTITLTGDGRLIGSSKAVESMFRFPRHGRGWPDEKIFQYFNGWSNGKLKIPPID